MKTMFAFHAVAERSDYTMKISQANDPTSAVISRPRSFNSLCTAHVDPNEDLQTYAKKHTTVGQKPMKL